MSNKQRYAMLQHAVPAQMLTPETQALLQWFSAYFNTFADHTDIDYDSLSTLVRMRSGSATPESITLTMQLVDQLRKRPSDDDLQAITAKLCELDLSGKAGALISQYNNGDEIDLAYELVMLSQKARQQMVEGLKAHWENRDIMELLNEETDEGGLQFNSLKPLALAMRGLRPGDNIGVAAPTDKGKSSLLCRFAIDMQAQAKELYPGRPTVYLVNEGTAARITTRLYGTAAEATRDGMLELGGEKLRKIYEDKIGGFGMIRVINIHGKNMPQIANILERHNPHLVISDMTGRIRAASNRGGGANDIGQLEEVWDEFRQQAAILEFAHIGTIQVSAEGMDQFYPPLSALQNSKTGIQSTFDAAIIMGAMNNPAMANIRGISTPKNKLARSGLPGLNRFQCTFEPGLNMWSNFQTLSNQQEAPAAP